MDDEQLDIWLERLRRPASLMLLGGFMPPEDPMHSWFGSVKVRLPGETWPKQNGRFMLPLCQINCEQLPYCPPALADIALMTVFIASPDADEFPNNTPNGDGWVLRAYPNISDLVPIDKPEIESSIRAIPARWKLIEADYPTHDDLPDDFPDELRDQYYDLPVIKNMSGTKVGGWPTNIQSEIYWAPGNRHPAKPEYVFQIDSHAKANWFWGDNGVGYFGRGTGTMRDVWAFDWQCM